MMWKRKKSKAILPAGYFEVIGQVDDHLHLILLKKGPYAGLKLSVDPKVKIREDALTGTPQLLYNYDIVDDSAYKPTEVQSEYSLSRIVAAILCELYNEELDNGAVLVPEDNNVKNRNSNPKKPNLQ